MALHLAIKALARGGRWWKSQGWASTATLMWSLKAWGVEFEARSLWAVQPPPSASLAAIDLITSQVLEKCHSWSTISIGWAGAPILWLPSSLCQGICSSLSQDRLWEFPLPLFSPLLLTRTQNKWSYPWAEQENNTTTKQKTNKKTKLRTSIQCESGLKGKERQPRKLSSTLLKERGAVSSPDQGVSHLQSVSSSHCMLLTLQPNPRWLLS